MIHLPSPLVPVRDSPHIDRFRAEITSPAGDLLASVLSVPKILPDILLNFIPYACVLLGFGAFVAWNGGIALGTGLLLALRTLC